MDGDCRERKAVITCNFRQRYSYLHKCNCFLAWGTWLDTELSAYTSMFFFDYNQRRNNSVPSTACLVLCEFLSFSVGWYFTYLLVLYTLPYKSVLLQNRTTFSLRKVVIFCPVKVGGVSFKTSIREELDLYTTCKNHKKYFIKTLLKNYFSI